MVARTVVARPPPAPTTDAERLTRFTRKAKATAALSHANILGVHDVGTHEGVRHVIEEWLDGESLRQPLAHGVRTAAPFGDPRASASRGVVMKVRRS